MARGVREFINKGIEVMALGAEAALLKTTFLGMEAVVKVRLPKKYRDPELDSLIRERRTVIEAKIIKALTDLGVNVPILLYTDPKTSTIIMEYLKGEVLRDVIMDERIAEACNYLKQVGSFIALMHRAGIAHGDVTTTNVIISEGRAYLIDFGLSKFTSRIEDLATDIHLFIRSLESTHYKHKDQLLECFTSGYRLRIKGLFNKVVKAAKEIRLRGRYVKERRHEAIHRHNK